MQTLAARRLQKRRQADVLHQRLHEVHRLLQLRPRDCLVGIEIEDDPVGNVELLRARSPRVNFENAHLQQRDDRCHRIGHHVLRRSSVAHHDLHSVDRFVRAVVGVLLIEAWLVPAVGTAHQSQRPILQMRQHPFADRGDRRSASVRHRRHGAGSDLRVAPPRSHCTRHHRAHRNLGQAAVAPHACSWRHHAAQLVRGLLRAENLNEIERHTQYDHQRDERRVEHLAEHTGDHTGDQQNDDQRIG